MRKKMCNRLLASALAGTMVLGMSTTALADPAGSGNTTGDGAFEGHVEKSVLSVELPTVPATNPFAYTMDPEGLIAATEGAKNSAASFETGANVYFLSAENTYTKDSAKLKVTNKGTVDADVTIEAETAANNEVTMASGSTFAGTGTELYLGLKVADQAAVAVKANGDATPASVTVGLKGKPDNYEVTYSNGAYGYAAKSGIADTAWNSFEFGLTGACNAAGDWSAASLAAPDVTVTWSYDERAAGSTATLLDENATANAGPSVPAGALNYERDASLDITVNFGAGDLAATSVTKIEASNDGTNVSADWTNACTISGNKITLASGKFGGASVGDTRYLIVTFNNGTKGTVTLNITK